MPRLIAKGTVPSQALDLSNGSQSPASDQLLKNLTRFQGEILVSKKAKSPAESEFAKVQRSFFASYPEFISTGKLSPAMAIPPVNDPIERQQIRDFWLSLPSDRRKDLVFQERQILLRSWKERQRVGCNCAYCQKKRKLVQSEIEMLYDTYYQVLDEYTNFLREVRLNGGASATATAASQPIAADPASSGGPSGSVPSGKSSYRHSCIQQHPSQIRFGLHNVAEDLLKNGGKKFLDILERIAERRIRREEGKEDPHRVQPARNEPRASTRSSAPIETIVDFTASVCPTGATSEAATIISNAESGSIESALIQKSFAEATTALRNATEGKEFSECCCCRDLNCSSGEVAGSEHAFDSGGSSAADGSSDEYVDDDYSDDENLENVLEEDDDSTVCSECEVSSEDDQLEEIFHLIAAMTFEQRITAAYRDQVALENQRKLLLEEEEQAAKEKQKEAEKKAARQQKKEKLRLQREAQRQKQLQEESQQLKDQEEKKKMAMEMERVAAEQQRIAEEEARSQRVQKSFKAKGRSGPSLKQPPPSILRKSPVSTVPESSRSFSGNFSSDSATESSFLKKQRAFYPAKIGPFQGATAAAEEHKDEIVSPLRAGISPIGSSKPGPSVASRGTVENRSDIWSPLIGTGAGSSLLEAVSSKPEAAGAAPIFSAQSLFLSSPPSAFSSIFDFYSNTNESNRK